MSIWNWVWEYAENAYQGRDPEQKKLEPLLQEGLNQFYGPDQNLAALEQGRSLAEKLGEPWWIMMFDHWRLQTLLYHKRDYKAALDLAVQSVVEVRKPGYATFPQRACLHEDLINAYVGIDPAGNAGQIEQAIKYMEREIGPDMECRFCLQALKIEFAVELNRLDDAEAAGAVFMAQIQGEDAHPQANAHQCLCQIAYARQDWQSLLAYAEEGEILAKRASYPSWVLEFRACQALANYKLGDEKAARKWYLLTATALRRNKDTPSAFFYNILSSYFEAAGNTQEALDLRQQQLIELQESGQLTNEVRCRVEICRKLSDKNKLEKADLQAAREAVSRLAKPTPYLSELEGLEE